MKRRWIKAAGCFLLAVLTTGTNTSTVIADTGPETDRQMKEAILSNGKEEVIYASLAGDGSIRDIYAVNEFEVSSAGSVTDYGDYLEIANLSTTEELFRSNDCITVPVPKGSFYYQGTMREKELPWIFSVTYFLDGKQLGAKEMAGRDGALEIHIKSRNNETADRTFYENYMLQVSVTLDSQKCSNIQSANGVIANAGKNKIVTHTILPKKDADISLTANVQNFSMNGIEIAAVPFTSPAELPDTKEMTAKMTDLSEGIEELDHGVRSMASGICGLDTGVGEVASGSADYAEGLSALQENSSELISGSKAIKDALGTICLKLQNSGEDTGLNTTLLLQMPDGLRNMCAGLEQVSDGLELLYKEYTGMFAVLDYAIMDIPVIQETDIALVGAAVAGMDDGDPQKAAVQEAFQRMISTCAAAQTVKGTYETVDPDTQMSIRAGMELISNSLLLMIQGNGTQENPGIAGIAGGLNTMAEQLETGIEDSGMAAEIGELTKGLSLLSEQYQTFHKGLASYAEGVDQLASGYSQLHGGLAELGEGTKVLSDGAAALSDGTGRLSQETADLPETIQEKADEMMEIYDSSDFIPVSFTSSKNIQIDSVQFVIVTEDISLPAIEKEKEHEPEKTSIWERFVDLFRF